MTTVDIQAGGHLVHIEHSGDLSYVAEKALELFKATVAAHRPEHSAVGFTAERRGSTRQQVGIIEEIKA